MKQNLYVENGTAFNLTCSSEDNWKRCIWKRASKRAVECEFEYVYLDDKFKWILDKHKCDHSINGNAIIDGSEGYEKGDKNHLCQLRFQTSQFSYEDTWTCILESCKEPKQGGCKSLNGSGIFAEATLDMKVVLQ